MDDDAWLELNIPRADVAVPPARYAVPAHTLPPLENGQWVTVGEPGGWWVIDELQVVRGPTTTPEGTSYLLAPMAEWGAARARPHEQGDSDLPGVNQRGRFVELSDIWVYRDSPVVQWVDELADRAPGSWYDLVVPDVLVPPSVLRPRPARELPSLTGRRVRVPLRDGWAWAVAVTEPVTRGEEIVVHLVKPSDFWALQYGVGAPEVGRRPLHQVWTY